MTLSVHNTTDHRSVVITEYGFLVTCTLLTILLVDGMRDHRKWPLPILMARNHAQWDEDSHTKVFNNQSRGRRTQKKNLILVDLYTSAHKDKHTQTILHYTL